MALLSRVRRRLQRQVRSLINPATVNVASLTVGRGVVIEPGVEINCERLVLGDEVLIRSGTRIDMADLVIGDYTQIHNDCVFNGTDWCRIGHNCWFGHSAIVNSTGTARIGNGVGVGAQSQLWSHIYFGDVMEGCRFGSESPLVIEDDVWFVGHCIVSPITARQRSMAMVGSVVTGDMDENHVYGGVPAKDMTARFGCQFESRTVEQRRASMEGYLADFLAAAKPTHNRIRIVDRIDMRQRELSQFSLTERVYLKHLYEEEVAFMRFLLPAKAKFNPHAETDWVREHASVFPKRTQ